MKLQSPYGSNKTPHFGEVFIIKLWLTVQIQKHIAPLRFLLDTGADITSLPISLAKKFGVDLATCKPITMIGYEGTEVVVYRSSIKIFFNNRRHTIPCVFTPVEHIPILLGRAGILDKFSITLDAKKKQITFKAI